ncbi:hypothetical protein GGS21DRAFT_484730 [Xylaria nigripes]|nr:hypothetical protein GGS21DRAFT_484730 [Xylaria nigripes]
MLAFFSPLLSNFAQQLRTPDASLSSTCSEYIYPKKKKRKETAFRGGISKSSWPAISVGIRHDSENQEGIMTQKRILLGLCRARSVCVILLFLSFVPTKFFLALLILGLSLSLSLALFSFVLFRFSLSLSLFSCFRDEYMIITRERGKASGISGSGCYSVSYWDMGVFEDE